MMKFILLLKVQTLVKILLVINPLNGHVQNPLPLFGPISAPHSMSLMLGLETKKLIVSTCRAIVKLELTNSKLDAKICDFEEHNHNGTISKDLSLPKKK